MYVSPSGEISQDVAKQGSRSTVPVLKRTIPSLMLLFTALVSPYPALARTTGSGLLMFSGIPTTSVRAGVAA